MFGTFGAAPASKTGTAGAAKYVDDGLASASAALSNAADVSTGLLGLREPTQLEALETSCCEGCPAMTYSQRLGGYCGCLFLGFCLSIGAVRRSARLGALARVATRHPGSARPPTTDQQQATRLGELVGGDPGPFAIIYSIANVVALCASLFLSGPYAQLKTMRVAAFPKCVSRARRFGAYRIVATCVYLDAIAATLFFAFFEGLDASARVGLIVACIFVQWLALLWYQLSFIPYAREYVASCAADACGDAGDACMPEACGTSTTGHLFSGTDKTTFA